MNKKNNKGFTLAELLIVAAIIAVLVAIAIPVFTNQLEESREATDLANIRSAYASLVTQYLKDGKSNSVSFPVHQKQSDWQGDGGYIEIARMGSMEKKAVAAKTSGDYTVSINEYGEISVS